MSFEGADVDNYGGDEDGHRKRDTSRKRDGKKDKKEKGYMMFEEEESDGENLMAEDLKSPSKAKGGKAKPFKFPVRKEKTKEKEEKKDKDAKKEEKEKRREEKEGKKLKKGKKNSKLHEPAVAITVQEDNPVFAVPLALAVERNKSHDGIELPAIVRECIDYIEECGLACEGIYRISGVKSKVQALKDSYNRHQPIYLYEHEPNIVASLLKQFLRDLPEPVLTTSMMPKFEEASTAKSNKKKVELFLKLIQELPPCNRLLLSWMIVHMSHVIDLAKENKMTLQNVSIVLSPTMRISHRVLNVLFSNSRDLFGDVLLRKYVPPLRPAHSKWSLELPDNLTSLEEELAKQESLLNQLHTDLQSGLKDPVIEEQLWEVQRVVTQLKRKIKLAKKGTEKKEAITKPPAAENKRLSNTSLPSLSAPEELKLDLKPVPIPQVTATSPTSPPVSATLDEPKTEGLKENTITLESAKTVKFVEPPATVTAPTKSKEKEAAPENKVEEKDKPEEAEQLDQSKAAVNENQEKEEGASNVVQKESKEENVEVTPIEKEEGEEKVKELQVIKEANEDKNTVEQNTTVDVVTEKVVSSLDNVVTKSEEVTDSGSQEKKEIENNVSSSTVTNMTEEKKQENKEVHSTETSDKKTEISVKEEKEKVSEKEEEIEVQKKSKESSVSSSTASSATPENSKEESSEPKRPTPVPPFMSLTLLEPVKAEIPTRKQTGSESSLPEEKEWRELEEELLGQKNHKRRSGEGEKTVPDDEDAFEDVSVEQLLEEEYALTLEEEELKAIADELRQKMATERSEMERLAQEIQELHYLRQDSDLEDMSSDSNSSDESEDEDDLQDLLGQLIKDNQDLETQNAEMCQKIHEERMICLSVKLQIRHLQQRQLEASCG